MPSKLKKHSKPMKNVFKIYIYILFELLTIPILIIYIPYLVFRKKKRAIKLMDYFYDTLVKIENKLGNF